MADAIDFDWGHDDRYRSNDGHGPLMARVLCAWRDGQTGRDLVSLERWDMRRRSRGKRTQFVLPLAFFKGPTCGWRLVP